jgi:ubiquinone/menaquinone biosynthesis C-methylase UbiE
MPRRSQLIPWKVAGRVTEGFSSGDDVVRETGWVFNNATGDSLTLAEFVATGDDEVPAYLEAFGLRAPENQDRSMVEIGSGIGRMTAAFSREFGHVIAADLDIGFLERCRETVARFGRVDRLRTLEVADGRSLDLGDGTVDLAFSYITLQHCVRDDALALAVEATRVTRPGGRIALNFRGPSRLDPLLLPVGALVRVLFGLPRIGEWLSQRRAVTRLAWQVSRLDATTVLDALEGRIDDVTIWSSDGRAERVPERVPVAAFGGINPNHWWLIATVR